MNNAVFFMGSPNVSGRNLIGYNITILFITKRVHEKKGRLKTGFLFSDDLSLSRCLSVNRL